ncbi:hypothetical protein PILCRDRAFT_92564 [Piloderma croceum F 1598]|uniref:Uncharacterized protein n=1 Tax=Piloderma croceum (strain F 1598) TaxID=765440 RepID=A0A0C3F357_PILCF|nr:hypothetical protein PILCRDRAFT_92564 [Piloderma croceum F 1598]
MASNASTTDKHTNNVLSAKQRPWKPIPMSPRLFNALPSAIPQALEVATRPCTQCKRLIPSTEKLKTCEKCRRKDREKSARKAARRKGASDVSVKRASVLVYMDDSEEEDGVAGEGWDQMSKRIKMEFGDAKRKGKVPVVKNTESKPPQPHIPINDGPF